MHGHNITPFLRWSFPALHSRRVVLCLPVNVVVCIALSIIVCPRVIWYEGTRAAWQGVTEGDWARAISLAKVMGVGAVERPVSPCVAVHAVPVLVARQGEMPDLMTSIASGPGFKVLGTGGVDVPSVAAHGAEVVHVDDWRGGRARGGVLKLGRAGDEVDEHVWGRGADCG
jgi:hypothetical protein